MPTHKLQATVCSFLTLVGDTYTFIHPRSREGKWTVLELNQPGELWFFALYLSAASGCCARQNFTKTICEQCPLQVLSAQDTQSPFAFQGVTPVCEKNVMISEGLKSQQVSHQAREERDEIIRSVSSQNAAMAHRSSFLSPFSTVVVPTRSSATCEGPVFLEISMLNHRHVCSTLLTQVHSQDEHLLVLAKNCFTLIVY